MTPENINVEESLNQLKMKSAALRQMSVGLLNPNFGAVDRNINDWAAHTMMDFAEEIFDLAERLQNHLPVDVLKSDLKGGA